MTEWFKEWIVRVAGAAMLTSGALVLAPKGAVRKVVEIVCGIVMLYVLLSSVTNLNYESFSENMAQYRDAAEAVTENASDEGNTMTAGIIQDELESYISDEGKELGIQNIAVSVALKWNTDGYWYPSGVSVSTDADDEQKSELSRYIESELGIPEEAQKWSTANGN